MTTHHREPAHTSSSRRLLANRGAGLALCGAIASCACSSDATTAGGTAGAMSIGGTTSGGSAALGGGGALGGTSAVGGSSATGGGGANAAGAPAGGAGGAVAGAAGMSGGGSAGTSGGGGTTGGGGGGGGTPGDCAGYALSLSANTTGSDPAGAHAEVDLGQDLPVGNANRTVELWAYMKAADWAANVNSLFFYGIANNGKAPGFGLDFGKTTNGIGSIDPFTNGLFDNDNQPSGVTVATSQWVHFAMTWDGTQVLAYVNGALKSTKVSDGAQKTLMTGTSLLTIGGYPIENAYFADYIDEFRVWNVTRSATDINATMKKGLLGNEAGLVGYWKFNETSGTTAADSVTTTGHTAHSGTLKGSPTATFAAPNPQSPVACP